MNWSSAVGSPSTSSVSLQVVDAALIWERKVARWWILARCDSLPVPCAAGHQGHVEKVVCAVFALARECPEGVRLLCCYIDGIGSVHVASAVAPTGGRRPDPGNPGPRGVALVS